MHTEPHDNTSVVCKANVQQHVVYHWATDCAGSDSMILDVARIVASFR